MNIISMDEFKKNNNIDKTHFDTIFLESGIYRKYQGRSYILRESAMLGEEVYWYDKIIPSDQDYYVQVAYRQ